MRLVRRSPEEPRQGAELEALLVASRAAAEHTDLEQALDTILDSALRLVGGHEGSIQLLDPSSMTLSVVASRGLTFQTRRQKVAVGQGVSGTVAVTGQPLLLPSAVDVDRFAGYVPKERRIFGAICVPLRSRQATIGVLNVNAMKPGTGFGEHELRLVTIFAETATLAIANSKLTAEGNRHAVELEMLRGATLRLASSLDMQTVAETTLQEALTIASSDAAFVCVTAEDGRDLELARFCGLSRDALLHVLSSPSFRRSATPADVRVIESVSTDPLFAPLARDLRNRALLLVPLRTAEGRSGGILGVAVAPDAGEEVRRLLRTYATQAALAIFNASLHRQVATREQELSTIVATLELPIILIDEEQRFRAINPAVATTFRLSPEFEVGQAAVGKLPPPIEELAVGRADDVTAEVDVDLGTVSRTYRVTAATVRSGRRAGARILLMEDVSAQRELERRKADFLAVIGHELRTPLTSIKGFARTLAHHGPSLTPEIQREAIGTIVTQSERLERLIEDLLFISRIETHRPPVRLAWEDIGRVCAEVVAEAGRRSPDRVFRFLAPPEEVGAQADRVKIEQMLVHLLDNAVKYSEPGRSVEVRLTADAHSFSIAVRDEGCGIYSGDLAKIFEPFTQLDGSATRRAGGTGVGLYVCQTLVAALGGRLEVDSALGQGSTFTLVLPRDPVVPQEPPAP